MGKKRLEKKLKIKKYLSLRSVHTQMFFITAGRTEQKKRWNTLTEYAQLMRARGVNSLTGLMMCETMVVIA